MKRLSFFFPSIVGVSVLLALATVISGCGGNKPKGFPKVVPGSISFKSGDEPAQYITVTISSKVPGQWTCGGRSGQTGEITLRTIQGQYAQEGVPIGEDLIVCASYDAPELPDDPEVTATFTRPEEFAQYEHEKVEKSREMGAAFQLPDFLQNPATSPIRWTTVKSKDPSVNHLELDVLECREMEPAQ